MFRKLYLPYQIFALFLLLNCAGEVQAQNLALNQPTVTSSIENGQTDGSFAVDGDPGTRWSSAFSDPQWIYVDLGGSVTISRVVLNWEAAFGQTYEIQVSDNATDWSSIFSESSGNGGIDDLNVSGAGRYVRMYGTTRATAFGYSLYEFEIYGTQCTGATLSDLTLDNETIEGFSSSKLNYSVELDNSVTQAPAVDAVSSDPTADVEIFPASAIPGITEVVVTTADESCSQTYTIEFDYSDNYVLVWSDEFDNDGAVEFDKWHHQIQLPAGGNWFNGEEQHYTNRLDNSYVENGYLHIVAKKENFTDQGFTKSYTSARLNSKYAFTYGRVDVRAKLPFGNGTWPAIWMLGQNINEPGGFWYDQFGTVNWPATGEIDIMEHWGNDPNVIHGSTHTPSSFGATINTGKIVASDVSNTFHIYSIIWNEEEIQFLIDDQTYYTYNPPIKNDQTWPFDEPQYMLLNIAMGGIYPIDPAFSESSMEIDYVRVYQEDVVVVPGSDASLSDLLVNNESIPGFSPEVYYYEVFLEQGTTFAPSVVPVRTDPNASFTISPATSLPGATVVTVTSEDESETLTYTVDFKFELVTGLDFGSLHSIKAYAHDGRLFVKNGESLIAGNIALFDLAGRKLLEETISNDQEVIPVPNRGVMILRISDQDNNPVMLKKILVSSLR